MVLRRAVADATLGGVRSQTEELAAELKQVIRLATRDPEALEGALPILSSFHKVLALGKISETARVHFILHRPDRGVHDTITGRPRRSSDP